MEIEFNTNGNTKQKQCAAAWIEPGVTEVLYGGAKGGAKSYTGCSLIFGDALMYPETHYFIARESLNSLRKYTVPSIYEVFKDWNLHNKYVTYNGMDNYWTLYNGSKVYFLEGKELPSDPIYERFGSMQNTRGWIEEGGEFSLEAKQNLQASIGRWKNDVYNLPGKLLITFNPSKNFLYEDYKNFKEGKLPEHKRFIQAYPHDNKKLPAGYVDNLYKILSPNQIERLIKGNWEYDDDPLVMMDYGKILELFTNTFIEGTGQMYLSADIAYEGSDLFVIGIWNGLQLVKVEAFDKCDETRVSKVINDLRVKNKIPLGNVIYDADGLRTFVKHSASSGYLNGAVHFHNNGQVLNKENYYNLKSQCYFKLAELANTNKIYIADRIFKKQIIEELEQIRKIEHADDGKLRVEKKDDLKERLRRSPDFADMLMMRMFYELKPRFKQSFGTVEGRVYEYAQR